MSVDMVIPAETVRGASVAPRSTMPSILSDIYQPENNIAIWQRPLSSEMTAHIKNMLQEGQPLALVQSVTPANAAEWIRNRLSDYECAEALGADIGLIVDMFCCLFDLQQVGLRLTALDKPMCPKFHVDQIPCRLVTTYVGSATEWLGNDDVDRRKLGAGAQGMADHLSGLFDNEQRINQMQSGDVALLKGGGWEGNEQTGLVHRSPELISNERRLLLTLDFI